MRVKLPTDGALKSAEALMSQLVAKGATHKARQLEDFGLVARITAHGSWEMVASAADRAAELGWAVSTQHGKIHLIWPTVSKEDALREVTERTRCTTVLAAGDSLLDQGMLLTADHGIHPAHGELHEGTRALGPTVQSTSRSGMFASVDILRWVLGFTDVDEKRPTK